MRLLAFTTAALLVLIPFASFAQDESFLPPNFRQMLEDENRNLPLPDEDQDLRELLQTILMIRLSQTLELSDEQILALSKRTGTYKDQLAEMKWQIAGARQELRAAVKRGEAEKIIEAKLEDCLMQEEAIADLLRTVITESRKQLTVEQAAKFYLFVGDFEHEMGSLVERARQNAALKRTQEQNRPPAVRNEPARIVRPGQR